MGTTDCATQIGRSEETRQMADYFVWVFVAFLVTYVVGATIAVARRRFARFGR
jgi:hypothetical protein